MFIKLISNFYADQCDDKKDDEIEGELQRFPLQAFDHKMKYCNFVCKNFFNDLSDSILIAKIGCIYQMMFLFKATRK